MSRVLPYYYKMHYVKDEKKYSETRKKMDLLVEVFNAVIDNYYNEVDIPIELTI